MTRARTIDDVEAALEGRLAELFGPGCDPYRAGAAILLDQEPDAISMDDRDLVKRVVMHILAIRRTWEADQVGDRVAGEHTQVLRDAAQLFHEVGSAIAAESLLSTTRNEVLTAKLRKNLRSRAQLRRIAAEGFELCVRALAASGAPDITIHECSEADGERPW